MKAIRLTITPKLLLVIALVAVLVVAVYAATVLFTQTVPPATVKPPSRGSPSMTGDCSTLSLSPNTITLSATDPTSGYMNVTCGGGPAFTVTSEGLFTASGSGGVLGPPFEYSGFNLLNYTTWQSQGCTPGNPTVIRGYPVPFTGSFVTLSNGDYVYCLVYYLQPYSTNSPSSIPGFTITWSSA